MSNIFSMAQLSASGWEQFLKVSSLFEKGHCKDQKIKGTEVASGKIVLRASQFKVFSGLCDTDRTHLLTKVINQRFNCQ